MDRSGTGSELGDRGWREGSAIPAEDNAELGRDESLQRVFQGCCGFLDHGLQEEGDWWCVTAKASEQSFRCCLWARPADFLGNTFRDNDPEAGSGKGSGLWPGRPGQRG